MYFEYLDLPCVPESLLKDIDHVIENHENIFAKKNFTDYKIFDATSQLKGFTKPLFPFEHVTRVQILTYHIPIHKDVNRKQAYNYVIDTGGSNVLTNFYNDNLQLIESICIEPQRWHRLDTQVYHSVSNLTAMRIALTVHEHLD